MMQPNYNKFVVISYFICLNYNKNLYSSHTFQNERGFTTSLWIVTMHSCTLHIDAKRKIAQPI